MKCDRCGRIEDLQKCACAAWFKRTCVVCLVTCIIGVFCCVYCTYMVLYINKHNVVEFSKEKSTKDGYVVKDNWNNIKDKINIRLHDELEQPVHINQTGLRVRRAAAKDNKGKKGKKEKKEQKEQENKKSMAAHYVIRNDLKDASDDFKNNCPQGHVEKREYLDIFTPASFVKSNQNPFEIEDRKFKVKRQGLYFVYAQVFYTDCRQMRRIKLVQERHKKGVTQTVQEIVCASEGINTSRTTLNNTCNINALFYLEKGDYLYIYNFFQEIQINVGVNDGTFFGAMMIR